MKLSLILLFLSVLNSSQYILQNPIRYNQLINQAELCIIDSNYSEALNYYQHAFEEIEYPFTRDYYNALLCATYTKKYDLAFDYMYKLVNKGIEYEKFDSNIYLQPLKNNERWPLFKNYYDENHQKIIAGFNLELKTELDSMHVRDQRSNKARYKDPSIRYKFDSTIYANIVRMKEIFEIYGFPTEEDLGVKNFNGYQFEGQIIIKHYFQICDTYNKTDTLNLLPILENACKNGKISTHFFLANLGDLKLNKYASNVIYLIDTNIILLNIDTNSLMLINANRAKLGIGTVAETQKKVTFYIKKIFKPIPIQEGEQELDIIDSIYNNIDHYYFLVGDGLFSHFVHPRSFVTPFVNDLKKTVFKLENDE